jgi:hypothetical protein
VTSVLAKANEDFYRCYNTKILGDTIKTVEQRVIEIFGVEKDLIYQVNMSRGGSLQAARSLPSIPPFFLSASSNLRLSAALQPEPLIAEGAVIKKLLPRYLF